MSSAGQRGADHSNSGSNHATPHANHGQESPVGEATSSSSTAATSSNSPSRVLRSTTERRRRTNLFSAFYPLLSRNSSPATSSSNSGGSSPSSSTTPSTSRANRGSNSNMSHDRVGNTESSVSKNQSSSSNNLRPTSQNATSASSSSNTRTPRGLSRVRQRMHDEVSLRSTRSSSSRTSSVRGVAPSSSAPTLGLSSSPYVEDDNQMEIDLDSRIGQRSHPSHYQPSQHHHHYHHYHSSSSAPSSSFAAATATTSPSPSSRPRPATALTTGQDHMTTISEPAGTSSGSTLRPATRYRTRAAQATIPPAPISTSNFGPSSISTTGATGIPEPSSASTASSMSDSHAATPVPFSRFSINLPNPRGGTSISSSLLPIRPDSDDEEQDMSLDPLIDHQPMATDDAETASSIAISMVDHHYHPRPSSGAPRRRDLNPPPELIAEIIHSQLTTHPSSSSNSRPLSTASSASSSMLAAAPTTTPGVSSSGSSITSEHRLTTDSYPMTRSRSAQLFAIAAAARASSSSTPGPSTSTSGAGNSSDGYQHLQYSSHMSHYGEGSSTSYASGRRPVFDSTESSSSTATLRRRTPGNATVEAPVVGAGASRTTSNNTATNLSSSQAATLGRRPTEETPSPLTLSTPTSSSTSLSSPTTPTTPTADHATRAAARERFRQLQHQLPLFSRILAHISGSRGAATANTHPRPGASDQSGSSTDINAELTASATAGSSTSLDGHLSSSSSQRPTPASSSSSSTLLPLETQPTNALPGETHGSPSSETAGEEGRAVPRLRRHHHGMRLIQLGSTTIDHNGGFAGGPLGATTNGEQNGDDDEGRPVDHGEAIILVLNAVGPLLHARAGGGGEEGEGRAAAGTTTPEEGQQDTNGLGVNSSIGNTGNGEPNHTHHNHPRPRGRPQWLVVTLSSAYLSSFLAGASLNLDGEGGMNYDDLWEFANLMGPARPVTTTQEAINQAGFHVGQFERAIPGMRDYATLGDATKCLVCMCEYEEGEDLRALGCKHGFHQECIDKWLTTGANKCPICRAAAVVPAESTTTAVAEE
ncbi:hypothetical protein BGZ73_000642 [Actinomortierella ambigua]|nr:hypothetical protein BGZ73_000642 [Actinomortierella ambigua]